MEIVFTDVVNGSMVLSLAKYRLIKSEQPMRAVMRIVL